MERRAEFLALVCPFCKKEVALPDYESEQCWQTSPCGCGAMYTHELNDDLEGTRLDVIDANPNCAVEVVRDVDDIYNTEEEGGDYLDSVSLIFWRELPL